MVATEHTVAVANHPGIHTDPRLHPARCRLFRQVRVLGAHVLVARERVKLKQGPQIHGFCSVEPDIKSHIAFQCKVGAPLNDNIRHWK